MLKSVPLKKFLLVIPKEFKDEFMKKISNSDYIHLNPFEEKNIDENYLFCIEKIFEIARLLNFEIKIPKREEKISYKNLERIRQKVERIYKEAKEIKEKIDLEEIIILLEKIDLKADLIKEYKYFNILIGFADKSILKEKEIDYKVLKEYKNKVLILVVFLKKDKDYVLKTLSKYNFEEVKINFGYKDVLKAKKRLEKIKKEVQSILKKIYSLRFLEIEKFSKESKSLTFFSGYIVHYKLNELENIVKSITNNYYLKLFDPSFNEEVPFYFRSEKLSFLTKIIGYPNYFEIDPSLFFTILYTIMFGMMAGDFGYGILYFFLGFLLYKFSSNRFLKNLGFIAIPLGISSMFFGFIYGEMFLMEFKEPLISLKKDIFSLMKIAVYFGIIQIIFGIVLNILNKIFTKDYKEAIFSHNGIVGLVYFIFIVLAAFSFVSSGFTFSRQFILYFSLSLSVLAIIFIKPFIFKKNFFEIFGELIEIAVSYLSNLISYVRLAAFAISHGAIAFLIHLFAGIPSIILANLLGFLMGTFSAAIQSLRLLFYEFSTKFYKGYGKEFLPLKKALFRKDYK